MNTTIDARGLACPQPVILTKKALEQQTENGTIEVLVDNEIASKNVQKFAGSKGLEVKVQKQGETDCGITITVGKEEIVEQNGLPQENASKNLEEEYSCVPVNRTVVVLSTDKMGEGDESLGKTLMKGFIYALTQQETLPKTILLYNRGAFLSTEGSASLEDLTLLQEEGVEILTCGTCLNHYGLAEKLKVGEVTNMYDIVERMTGASKLIRP